MQLYLKQKVFSIKGRYDVYDAAQETQYTIEGKYFSLRNVHTISDASGAQVASVSRKIISLMPKFFIDTPDGSSYEMKGKLAFAHEVYELEALGWTLRGDFLAHDYTITKDDQEIASIHQKWLAWGDTFEITIADDENAVLVLAAILCLDIAHDESNQVSATETAPDPGNQ